MLGQGPELGLRMRVEGCLELSRSGADYMILQGDIGVKVKS